MNRLLIPALARSHVMTTKPVIDYVVVNRVNLLTVFNSSKFSTSGNLRHGDDHSGPPGHILVKFQLKDGTVKEIKAREGEIALRLAQRHDIPMEGACEASLACTTCHCYVDDEYLDRLPEATETEEDLLDMAPFLEMNSRLGCQIVINEDLEGITLRLPRATKNFYVDGHVPQPH